MEIRFKEEVILKVPSGSADGEMLYRELPGTALKVESYAGVVNTGSVNDETVFLIKTAEWHKYCAGANGAIEAFAQSLLRGDGKVCHGCFPGSA